MYTSQTWNREREVILLCLLRQCPQRSYDHKTIVRVAESVGMLGVCELIYSLFSMYSDVLRCYLQNEENPKGEVFAFIRSLRKVACQHDADGTSPIPVRVNEPSITHAESIQNAVLQYLEQLIRIGMQMCHDYVTDRWQRDSQDDAVGLQDRP